MFEQKCKNRVKNALARNFNSLRTIEEAIKFKSDDCESSCKLDRSANERNMTRKTRSHQLRIPSAAFQSGFCGICHKIYSSLKDHIRSKRHINLIGDDANFIALKGFDDHDTSITSFLTLDGIDAIAVTGKTFDSPPHSMRGRMSKRRAATVACDRLKESPLSPSSDSVHRLRSRKQINYMTPPLEEDSLSEKPEVNVKEFRGLRSSSRLLRKLSDQIVESDEVWNSGRPKRACNRQRTSADERLMVDNKGYYKMDVLPSKLRSGAATPFRDVVRRCESPVMGNDDKAVNDDKGLLVKFQIESSEDENETDHRRDSSSMDSDLEGVCTRKIKVEDDESLHSNFSDGGGKGKRKRRTHAEAFIMDNQKYYKFETPGSRLRYQGSWNIPMKSKINGDCTKVGDGELNLPVDKNNFKMNFEDYGFSFERVPKSEQWYQTFRRRDTGEEKYIILSDDNYWDPLILPYQLEHLQPLDPKECISQYNQIKKCLMEPVSASTSVGCSTPDPNTSNSNSSVEPPYIHDDDSKLSTTMTEVSSVSTLDEFKPTHSINTRKRTSQRMRRVARSGGGIVGGGGVSSSSSGGGKNPRKSPRQHASTLAILSSLIQQRKRKSRNSSRGTLPTIVEERSPPRRGRKPKIDYLTMARNIEEEFAMACNDDNIPMDTENFSGGIDFRGRVDVVDLLNMCDQKVSPHAVKRFFSGGNKPGRKPGRKKKNRTGWPNRKDRRTRRKGAKEEDDNSTIDSCSVNADSEEIDDLTAIDDMTDRIKNDEVNNCSTVGENNNKNDQSRLGDVNSIDENCDDYLNDNRVGGREATDKVVLSSKVNNASGGKTGLKYQPYVRVQKLDKNHIDSKSEDVPIRRRSNSPKRTNRGQRRMPASPKSPRMLRRPRGRWYRER